MSDELTFQQELPVEVKAGQTLVVEIVARDASTLQLKTGSFSITVTTPPGESVKEVYLVAPAGFYRIPLTFNAARLDDVVPGTYLLTLAAPAQGTELQGTLSPPPVV